jgi:hypothetical protein
MNYAWKMIDDSMHITIDHEFFECKQGTFPTKINESKPCDESLLSIYLGLGRTYLEINPRFLQVKVKH